MSKELDNAEAELRAQLGNMSDAALRRELEAKRAEFEKLDRSLKAADFVGSTVKQRARGIFKTTLTAGANLDRRFENLFDAVKERKGLWPLEESIQVADGVIGRVMAKRIWAALLGLLTLLPAIVTLLFLASQNSILTEQNRIEGQAETAALRANLLETIFQHSILAEDGWPDDPQPRWHPRLRSEAIASLIALEKEQWTVEERNSFPPQKFVQLEDAHLELATISIELGLLPNQKTGDLSRIDFTRANLQGAQIFGVDISGSKFTGANLENAWIYPVKGEFADFSGVNARGVRFQFHDTDPHVHEFTNASFFAANFVAASFSSIDFDACNFSNANFAGATLTNVEFLDSVFTETNFSGTMFDACFIIECDFRGLDLRGLNFSNSVMKDTSITGCLIDDTTRFPADSFVEEDAATGQKWIFMKE